MNRRNFLKRGMATLVTLVAGKVVLADVDILKDEPVLRKPEISQIDGFRFIQSGRQQGKSIWSEKLLDEWYGKSHVSHPEVQKAQI